ncbi:TetR/AcrR family transcriptional regulator [Paenibacillus sediminis]|uniref:AcrR family transcriptional regulator n=1 Tax=Paenibacillus sediminis TaxID=664909 RepID=A0ABS4H435_9BACL|nr:TetR/AcrR family transcriptional regulator [Paenibacillus sediminis]MBP1937289.1 AcrR family transcriptional regulator [Paenibacillus sediminis]
MSRVDRRIVKSKEAIIKAVIELMSEKDFDDISIQDIADRANVTRGTIYVHYGDKFDLLDKLITNHLNQLKEIYKSTSEMDFIEGTQICFEYFQCNYSFYLTMLKGKGAPSFRTRLLETLIEEGENDKDITKGKNSNLNKDIVVQFFGMAYVGVVEWWILNGMPYPPQVMAEQVGVLLERNL